MTLTTQQARLDLVFSNYWHAGSGRSSGYNLDALCERNQQQLPYFPGRQLKGLLRQAVARAEDWGWFDELPIPQGPFKRHEELLFGSTSQEENRHTTQPGLLLVDSANLPDAERQWLAHDDQSELRSELFAELFSTAINDQGSAQRYSLRGLEVCIPLTLVADLSLAVTAQQPEARLQQQAYLQQANCWSALTAALPLLDALGAHRSRGLGEAQVSLTIAKQGA